MIASLYLSLFTAILLFTILNIEFKKPSLKKEVKKKNHYLVASITAFFEDGRS